MAQRLDELVAATFSGREIEIDVHRVTPLNRGRSQFRGIVNYANGAGVAEQGVLDLLVGEREADILFDARYVSSIAVAEGLVVEDSFPVIYRSLGNHEAMPIELVAIGDKSINNGRKDAVGKDDLKPKELENPHGKPKYSIILPKEEQEKTSINYTLEQNGLVTIVKDVVVLDRGMLWIKTKLKTEGYAGAVLGRETERHGFAAYQTHTRTGSLKRVTLVPRGTEERMYKGLTLDEFTDVELLAKEHAATYCAEQGITANPRKAARITIHGKEYYIKKELDALVGAYKERKETVQNSKEDKSKKGSPREKKEAQKGEPKDKNKEKRSLDGIIEIDTYCAKGTTTNGIYNGGDHYVPLFDETKQVVKYGNVFNVFTPDGLKGNEISKYQDKMRRAIAKTTAAKERKDAEGKPIPETEIGRGKKHYLEVETANKCIQYLIDVGYVPIKKE